MMKSYTHEEVRAIALAQGIPSADEPGDLTPAENPSYRFPEEILQVFLAFWFTDQIGFKVLGPEGCGKSEFVKQFFAALRWPLLQPLCGPRTDEADLRGQMAPAEGGGFAFVEGHLVLGMKMGIPVFMDEYNLMPSSVITALNPVLDGANILIPETGEVVKPAEGFRVIVAENPNDRSLGFHGRNEEDVSNKARFMTYRMGYDSAEEEALHRILAPNFGAAAVGLAQNMCKLAQKIRDLYMGDSDAPGALEVNLSTRTLIRWAHLMTNPMIVGMKSARLASLRLAYTNAHSREFAAAVEEHMVDIFGEE